MNGRMTSCFETDKIRQTIEELYIEESDEWHKNIHKNGGTVQENIDDSFGCISIDEVVYRIEVDGVLAAFFSKFTNGKLIVLNAFHVRKEFRNRIGLKMFWECVDKHLGSYYYAGLCTKNLPAILHLIRNGFQQINEITDNGKKFVILRKFL